MTSDRDRREHLFNFGIVIDYIAKKRYFDDMELAIVQLIERVSTNKEFTIMVVDDSSFMRNHLRILLSKRGFKVINAIDGKQALDKMKSTKIDAAIYFRLDKQLKFLYANDSLSNLITKGRELEKELVFDAFVKPRQEAKLSALKTAIQEGNTFHETFCLKSDAFHDVHLRLTFTPLEDEDKGVQEGIVIGFDLSLLQKKEATLKDRIDVGLKKNWEQNKLLIQQSKMGSMGEMIGHIGHQWRQPLNALGLMFQKLDRVYHKQLLTDELMEQSMQKSMRIIKQMSKTIDDFRNFFKNDKKMQLCPLIDVVHQAQDIIEPALTSNHINLKINENCAQLVPCLKNELSQVILNIIANAMDALVGNNVEYGEITITTEEHQNEAYMIIDDNAGGIPEEIIEKIFEPYFTTKSDSNDTGIGLYMSKAIIEEHMSGKLEIYNTLSGASFKITLPTDIEISDIECNVEN